MRETERERGREEGIGNRDRRIFRESRRTESEYVKNRVVKSTNCNHAILLCKVEVLYFFIKNNRMLKRVLGKF